MGILTTKKRNNIGCLLTNIPGSSLLCPLEHPRLWYICHYFPLPREREVPASLTQQARLSRIRPLSHGFLVLFLFIHYPSGSWEIQYLRRCIGLFWGTFADKSFGAIIQPKWCCIRSHCTTFTQAKLPRSLEHSSQSGKEVLVCHGARRGTTSMLLLIVMFGSLCLKVFCNGMGLQGPTTT